MRLRSRILDSDGAPPRSQRLRELVVVIHHLDGDVRRGELGLGAGGPAGNRERPDHALGRMDHPVRAWNEAQVRVVPGESTDVAWVSPPGATALGPPTNLTHRGGGPGF